MKLAKKLVDGFHAIDGVTTYCCDSLENHLATITMNVEGLEAGDVGIMLDVDFNIATRTGLHCAPLVHKQLDLVKIHGGVRFAIGPFNTEDHIDKALEAIADISELVLYLKKRGIGILITDHRVRETLDIVDRASILFQGEALFEGTPDEIRANKDVRRVYLGDKYA